MKRLAELIPARIRNAVRFGIGPFPLSISLHLMALLLLIVAVHTRSNRELINVSLEAGDGRGDSGDVADLDMPEVPMPNFDQAKIDLPSVMDASAVTSATEYVRDISTGGIGLDRGGGIGPGHGYGIGTGFGGFITTLRRRGLDVVLVIDGTGSMKMIIDQVKAQMEQLVATIHRMVPIARVGIVVYGGHTEPIQTLPLTRSPMKMTAFLNGIQAVNGDEWSENMLGGLDMAIDKMEWQPKAKKVVVLVGDSPPSRDEFAPIMSMLREFRIKNGTLNVVNVAPEEHELFEQALSLQLHGQKSTQVSAQPEFVKQTGVAFTVLSSAGGGTTRELLRKVSIDQQLLVLAFGNEWERQLAAFRSH